MRRFDARAWVVWVLAGTLLAVWARNPLYLLVLIGISRIVEDVCRDPANRLARLPFWRFAAVILVFSTLFNVLTAHVGETVLFHLPDGWWLVGGPLTAEAAVYGFVSGLSLVTILSFFLAFNTIVPVHQLTRLTPRAFHELGLVLLVAVTYVPELTRQWQRIREAQAIRGHRIRSWREWRPLALPLLVGGLERSLNLAETMVARGYASADARTMRGRTQALMLAGLSLALLGVIALAWQSPYGWAAIGGGALAIGIGLWSAGRSVVVSRYRPAPWGAGDTLVVGTALVALLVPLIVPDLRPAMAYSPYPALSWPAFNLAIGLSLLLLLSPALLEIIR